MDEHGGRRMEMCWAKLPAKCVELTSNLDISIHLTVWDIGCGGSPQEAGSGSRLGTRLEIRGGGGLSRSAARDFGENLTFTVYSELEQYQYF